MLTRRVMIGLQVCDEDAMTDVRDYGVIINIPLGDDGDEVRYIGRWLSILTNEQILGFKN